MSSVDLRLSTSSNEPLLQDSERLEKLGYKQELHRGFNSLMAVTFSFTSVAVVSSITSLFPTALNTGGPAVIFWSWIGASILTVTTGLCMAEISSTYPSAGSVYYWAGLMTDEKWSPIASYTTGWFALLIRFNLLGNVAADAFFATTFSDFTNYAIIMYGADALTVQQRVMVGIFAMFVWALANLLRVDLQGSIHSFAACLQVIFSFTVLISLWSTCHDGQVASLEQIMTVTYNGTGFDSFPYVVLIGMLSALYSFTGYEAAGHMAEETQNASVTVPKGIVYTCAATALTGFVYIISLLFASAYNVDEFVSSDLGVSYIFQKCMGTSAAAAMTVFILVNLFFSGMSSLTVTVRTTWAISRDGGYPFSAYVQQVNPVNKVPGYSVLATFLMGSTLLLLQLISSTAFVAVTSISTIGFQISYAIPILLRVTTFRKQFVKSDFHLGQFGVPLGFISGIFLVVSSILFALPVEYPMTYENFNYTIVVFLGTAIVGGLYWILFANKWFRGPRWRSQALPTLN